MSNSYPTRWSKCYHHTWPQMYCIVCFETDSALWAGFFFGGGEICKKQKNVVTLVNNKLFLGVNQKTKFSHRARSTILYFLLQVPQTRGIYSSIIHPKHWGIICLIWGRIPSFGRNEERKKRKFKGKKEEKNRKIYINKNNMKQRYKKEFVANNL